MPRRKNKAIDARCIPEKTRRKIYEKWMNCGGAISFNSLAILFRRTAKAVSRICKEEEQGDRNRLLLSLDIDDPNNMEILRRFAWRNIVFLVADKRDLATSKLILGSSFFSKSGGNGGNGKEEVQTKAEKIEELKGAFSKGEKVK